MGANNSEYTKTLAQRLEDDHDNSKVGSLYEKKLKKLLVPGLMAPMAGTFAQSALSSTGFDKLGDYAMMGGSALGALASPLLFRAQEKQAAKNTQDENARNRNLRFGGHVSGMQATDSVLNAGKSIGNAASGAFGLGYAAQALTGQAAFNPATLMTLGKMRGSFSNVGGAAYMAANQMAGANYLAPLTGGHSNQNALMQSAVGHLGDMTGSSAIKGAADWLGGGSAQMLGMLPYMLATSLGSKLTKSIKNKANGQDNKKYNYRVSDIGRPASSNQAIEKYDTMQSASSQINLLSVTGQLSPYETLALGYFQNMAKRLAILPALYDMLSVSNDTNKSKVTHNEILDLLNENKTSEFTTTNNYTNHRKKGSVESSFESLEDFIDNIKDSVYSGADKISAMGTIFNPIKMLTGGLFGNSSLKLIKARYGLDEDSKIEEAQTTSATQLNIPTAMAQLAEMDVGQILSKGETVEEKQLAVQTFSASLIQQILQLKLDDRGNNIDGKGFFNRTQDIYDTENNNTKFKKIEDKILDVVGNIPIFGTLAAYITADTAQKKLEEERKQLKEENKNKLLNNIDEEAFSDVNFGEASNSTSFIDIQFPQLFLNSISLDEHRNKLLEELVDLNGGNAKNIKQKQPKVFDSVTGNISSLKTATKNQKTLFKENLQSLREKYDTAIESDPRNKKEYQKKFAESAHILKKEHLKFAKNTSGLSLQANSDKEKEEQYKQHMLKAFDGIIELVNEEKKSKGSFLNKGTEVVSKNIQKGKTLAVGGLMGAFSKVGTFAEKMLGKAGPIIVPKIGQIFGSVFALTRKYPKVSKLAAIAGMGYLAYEKLPFIKKSVDKILGVVSPYFSGEEKEGNEEKQSLRQKIGTYMSAIGTGLLALSPAPQLKLIGGIMALAGMGMSANWTKIFHDFIKKFPIFGTALKAVGVDIGDVAPVKVSGKEQRSTQHSYNQTKTEKYQTHMDKLGIDKKLFSIAKISSYDDGLTKKIKDSKTLSIEAKQFLINRRHEEEERQKEFLKKADLNHDGKIDAKDREKDQKKFDKLIDEFKKQNTEQRKETQQAYIEFLKSHKESLKNVGEITGILGEQTKAVMKIAAQVEATKFKISSLD